MEAPGLLSRAVEGDTEALAELFRSSDPKLRRELTPELPKRWQSLLDIDDLLQETYTDAFLSFVNFVPRGPNSFEQWLATIARNNLRTAIRDMEAEKRGGRSPKLSVEDASLALYCVVSGSRTTPSTAAARREAIAAIGAGVARLPEVYRAVVRGCDLEGHASTDLAAALGRSPGAICMLRARAHRLLRTLVGAPDRPLTDFA